jgi:hypothetical protein
MAREFSIDGSWLRGALPSGTLSILHAAGGQAGPLDIEYESSSGERYLATVATLADLRRLMETWRETGESLGGRYLWISDLIVVDELSADVIAEVVEDLVTNEEVGSAMQLVTEASDPPDELLT